MSVFFLVIEAADGEHIFRYATEAAARSALTRQIGRERPEGWSLRTPVVDDAGRRLHIEVWPDGTTLRDRRDYGAAYEARECGTLTRAQSRLLKRMEGA